jgi:hypothetical protein
MLAISDQYDGICQSWTKSIRGKNLRRALRRFRTVGVAEVKEFIAGCVTKAPRLSQKPTKAL